MLKNYVPAEHKVVREYVLVFDDGHGNGYEFPCDSSGSLLPDVPDEARENCKRCLEHPEQFVRFDEVVEYKRKIRENAHGTCICGEEVELYDAYLGACQCPRCGRWYNLFGQELIPPEYWEE